MDVCLSIDEYLHVSSIMGHVPSDGGAPLVGVSIALSVLQIVFVAARFYTRFVQRVRCGVDDYVILFALVCMLPIVSPLNILILILSPIRLEVSPRRLSILSVSTALLFTGQPMKLISFSGRSCRTWLSF